MVDDVTFVKTRTYYQPYDDYYRLAELSGYPICYLDEIDAYDPSKVYIISPLNGEWQHGWPGARARIVLSQLEWHTDRSRIELPPGVSEAWTSDRWHADLIGARFVPIGSHPELNMYPGDEPAKEYDVAFLAAPCYRRYQIWGDIAERGLSVAPNGWADSRHSALSKSRCMVIAHQWEEFKCIAPLRWALCAAYKLPIISETVWCRDPFGHGHFMTCDLDRLGEFTEMHVRDPYNQLSDYGLALHGFLCHEMTFRKSIERAL